MTNVTPRNSNRSRQSSPTLIDDDLLHYADRITTALGKGRDSMFEIAIACAEAVTEFPNERDQRRMRELMQVSFSASKLSKYVKIGMAKWLHDPTYREKIPHEYSITYYLAELDKACGKNLIANGAIHQNMSRKEAEALVVTKQSQPITPVLSKELNDFYAAISLKSPVKQSVLNKIENTLNGLLELDGVQIVYPWQSIMQKNDDKEFERQKKVHAKLISLAKELIRDTINQKLKTKPSKMTKRDFLNRMGWEHDVLQLQRGDDEARIRAVLSALGREDEYESLHERATLRVPEIKFKSCNGYPENIVSDDVERANIRSKISKLDFNKFNFDAPEDSSRKRAVIKTVRKDKKKDKTSRAA